MSVDIENFICSISDILNSQKAAFNFINAYILACIYHLNIILVDTRLCIDVPFFGK